MGTNQHYVPTHAGTYSQQHDFECDLAGIAGVPTHKHVKPALMSDFRPAEPVR